MNPFFRMILIGISLAGMLSSGRPFPGETTPAEARQLTREEARAFLAHPGIWAQISADLAVAPPQGRNFGEPPPSTAADGAEDDQFGVSVAVDGDRAVVGAPFADVSGRANQGAAYIFTRSGTSWTQQGKLVAADGAAEDKFGASVTLSGDAALVGAFGAAVSGAGNHGAAYVFTRNESIWSEQDKLVGGMGRPGIISEVQWFWPGRPPWLAPGSRM